MTTDNLLLLPVDILVHIFKKLQLSDLRNVMLTCKTLRDIIKYDNRIWRTFSETSLILQDGVDNRLFHTLSWYNRYRIARNWQSGCYKIKELVRHYIKYMPWLKLHNSEELLVTVGSELVCYQANSKGKSNLRTPLWKFEVPKILRNDVRTNDISRFVLRNNLIVCGNRDGCVAVYRIDNMQRKPKLERHIKDCHENGQVEVSAVEVIEDRDQLLIVTGSTDNCNLLFCTLKSENDIRTIPNASHNVMYIPIRDCVGTKCLSLNKSLNRLAIGLNGNNRPTLLDVNNAQFLLTSEETANQMYEVRDIQWHNENTIVYVTYSGFLQLLDTRTGQVACTTKDPFQSTLYCLKTDGENGIVVGSAEYSRCVLFDARKPMQHVQMYFTQRHVSPVFSLDFDSTKLITAVDRGVAILNFNIDPSLQPHRDYSSHVFH